MVGSGLVQTPSEAHSAPANDTEQVEGMTETIIDSSDNINIFFLYTTVTLYT